MYNRCVAGKCREEEFHTRLEEYSSRLGQNVMHDSKRNIHDEFTYWAFYRSGIDTYMLIAKTLPDCKDERRSVVVKVTGPEEGMVRFLIDNFLDITGIEASEAGKEDKRKIRFDDIIKSLT